MPVEGRVKIIRVGDFLAGVVNESRLEGDTWGHMAVKPAL